MEHVQRELVAGHVDVATLLKLQMMEAETERHVESSKTLLQNYIEKKSACTRWEAKGGVEGTLAASMRPMDEHLYDIGKIRNTIAHCERMIEIEKMWGGVGTARANDVPRANDIPKSTSVLEWKMFCDTMVTIQPFIPCARDRPTHNPSD
jgi:hypothetical protein